MRIEPEGSTECSKRSPPSQHADYGDSGNSSHPPGLISTPEPSAPALPPPSYDDVMSDSHLGSDQGMDNTSHPQGADGLSPDGLSNSNAHGTGTESDPLVPPGYMDRPPLELGHDPNSMTSSQFFGGLEYKRSSKGYSSCDPWLNTDPRALMRFLNEANDRPRVTIEIEGSHEEERFEDRTIQENGQTRTVTDSRREKVVDFKFSIELTPYIHEKGTIYTARRPNGEPYELVELVKDYVNADNVLKILKVQKKVIWDYELVRSEIIQCISRIGYPHTVTVRFPMDNDRIVVRSHRNIARVWRHPVTSFLCFVSCLWIIGYPIEYFSTQRWRNKVMSDFVVVASPKDFVVRNLSFITNQVAWSNTAASRWYPGN